MAPQRSSRVPTALGSCGRSTSSLGRSPGASEATRGVHGNTTWRWEASAGVRENSPPLTSASEEGKTSYGKSPKKSSSLRMLRHRGSVQQKRRRRRRASGRQQVGSFYLETIRYNRCLFISTMGRVHYAGGGREPAAARTPRYHKTLCITAAHNTRGGVGGPRCPPTAATRGKGRIAFAAGTHGHRGLARHADSALSTPPPPPSPAVAFKAETTLRVSS